VGPPYDWRRPSNVFFFYPQRPLPVFLFPSLKRGYSSSFSQVDLFSFFLNGPPDLSPLFFPVKLRFFRPLLFQNKAMFSFRRRSRFFPFPTIFHVPFQFFFSTLPKNFLHFTLLIPSPLGKETPLFPPPPLFLRSFLLGLQIERVFFLPWGGTFLFYATYLDLIFFFFPFFLDCLFFS